VRGGGDCLPPTRPRLLLRPSSFLFLSLSCSLNLSLSLAGLHTAVWRYHKDGSFSRFSDRAQLQKIMVQGTRYADKACTPCSPGLFLLPSLRSPPRYSSVLSFVVRPFR